MSPQDLSHWSNLVGNVFQSILGENEDRVDIIHKWVLSLLKEQKDLTQEELHNRIREYCKPYFSN